jgi:peptidylprolyl isomerase
MRQAKNGDMVKVHYTGKLENGEVFDTSKDRQPLEFTIGDGDLIPGFEEGIIDMEIGETKSITIPSEKAYGPRKEELVVKVTKDNFPDDITPVTGHQLQVKQKDGNLINLTITGIDEDTVTLDANHPLAGYDLIFDVELMEIA